MSKRRINRSNVLAKRTSVTRTAGALLDDVRAMIQAARLRTAQAVNAGLVALYWGVGERIRREVLKEKRAGYGEEIVHALSGQLTTEFGKGFGRSNLFDMVRFAEAFPDAGIVQTLSGQLGWSHFIEIIRLADPLRRDFYAEMCRIERWSVRTLRQKIDGMLFERTAISKKPEKVIRQDLDALRDSDRVTPDLIFRDPYVLDFLGLTGAYAEKDLEAAILREMEQFILELGSDFAFVARQKRITLDHEGRRTAGGGAGPGDGHVIIHAPPAGRTRPGAAQGEVCMNKVLATVRGGRVELDSPVRWPDGTRLEVRPLGEPANGDPAAPASPNVRPEFLAHMNDPDRYGMDESLWPRTQEEIRILLDHMAAAEPLDYTPEEQAAIEADRAAWKELQKELMRKNWEETHWPA